MSITKRLLDEVTESGFVPTDATICAGHIEDRYLRNRFGRRQAFEPCALCSQRQRAVSLDDVLHFTLAMIRAYRGRALNDLYFDVEGPYGFAIGEVQDTSEAVFEIFEGAVDDDLMMRLQHDIGDDCWYKESSLWLVGKELLTYSWQQWAEATRTGLVRTREQWSSEGADGIRHDELLERLGDVVELLDLVRPAAFPGPWFRAVAVPLDEFAFDNDVPPQRIGTVPDNEARPFRMNRAGEGLFYGAAKIATALREIHAKRDDATIVVGEWRTTRPLWLLDLTRLPRLPSFFDLEHKTDREMLGFLQGFAANVSKPVGLELEAEYRPTQDVTAYFRNRFHELDGIVYASSLTGRPCCTLFVSNDECASVIGRIVLASASRPGASRRGAQLRRS
jgi:hypothetical protein